MELLPLPCSGARVNHEDLTEWVANSENAKQTPENPEEMEAHTERSWVLVLGVASVLLVICTISLFMVISTSFSSDDAYSRSRSITPFYDLTPMNPRSHLERGMTDGVLELDLTLLSEEMAALTKRTEEISQLVVAHSDALRGMQGSANSAQCTAENDWAPASTIDEEHTSPSVGRKPGQLLPWFFQPSLWAPHGPEVTLAVGPVQKGYCFAFTVPGQIQVHLPHAVTVSGWGITALMSESQPQRIRAIALPSGDDLGTLDFDRRSSSRMQTVPLATAVQTQTVRFLVDSSFGASFCCLYRLHVFG